MSQDTTLPPLPKPKASGLGDEYESFDSKGPPMGKAYANIDYFTTDQMHAYARAAIAAPQPDHADHVPEIAARLRHVAELAGCSEAVPEQDATAVGAIFSVLGNIRRALEKQAQGVPAGCIAVPVLVLKAASDSLGSFVSDHGWSDADMQAMDNLDAYLAPPEVQGTGTKGGDK